MSNKSILAFLLIALVLCFAASVTAQTCKNSLIAFDPTPCSSCTVCTGVTKSCCTSAYDTTVGIGMLALQVAKAAESCQMYMKMYSCAVCDVNNAKYYTSSGITICKSMCQKIVDSCGGASISIKDCSSYPDSNCWNSAMTGKVNWMLFAFAAVYLFFMF